MSYTQTWYLNPNADLLSYRRALADIRTIAKAWLSGLSESERGRVEVGVGPGFKIRQVPGEAFLLRESPRELLLQPAPSWDSEHKRIHCFCKTGRYAYDHIVTAALTVLSDYLGDNIRIYSDGDAEEWQEGVSLANRVLGRSFQCPELR